MPSWHEEDGLKKAGIFIVALIIGVVALSAMQGLGTAYAEEDSWKQEFADICSQTENSMSLTKEELKTLIERCDALKPRIEKLDEAPRKVYLKRLKMCRDLLAFVLDTKMQKE